VAPDSPSVLPLQSISLRTVSAPFLSVGSGLSGVGLVGVRRRSIRAEALASRRQLVALRVVWPFPQAPPFRRSEGRIPVSWVVGTTTCRTRGRTSPSKTLFGSRGPCPRLRGLAALPVRSGLLSWGSKIAPPPVRMPRVHSEVGRSPPFGLEAPTSRLVPPLSFHPTPTVFSAQHPAGLLHPATGHGVRHVSGASFPRRPKAVRGVGSFPDGACPSKLFPPWQPFRVATVRALSLLVAASAGFPRALPRVSGPFGRRPQPQGFSPPENPLLPPRRCRRDLARCFLGLGSSQLALSNPAHSGPEGLIAPVPSRSLPKG
jgi:hypothetical protein